MADNMPEKKGKDFGLDPKADRTGAPESYDTEFRYRNLPQARDQAIWADPSNFDHNAAHRTPMDGLDATVECLFGHKIRIDMQGDSKQ